MRQYLREFEITGRGLPTATARDPEITQMRIFAPNYVVAKSRFFYHMKLMKGVKSTSGEILSLKEIRGSTPGKIKNFEVFLKIYNRRVGFINMRKEFRATSRSKAVSQAYVDVASRNRGKFFDISVIGVKAVNGSQVRSENMRQFVADGVKFPLMHKVPSIPKSVKFSNTRPRTY